MGGAGSGYNVAQWVRVTVAALHVCSLGSIFSTGKKKERKKQTQTKPKNSPQKIKLRQYTLLLTVSSFS